MTPNLRIGCLGALALWAILGVYSLFTRGVDDDSDGKFALIGLLGVVIFVVARLFDALVTWEDRRKRSRGGG
jgi:hypothetical protein